MIAIALFIVMVLNLITTLCAAWLLGELKKQDGRVRLMELELSRVKKGK